MDFLKITPYDYPDTPQVEVGKFLVNKNGNYAHQRETDVLFINPKGLLICCHEVGFLEDHEKYTECTQEEFATALNTVVFDMNILDGKYKLITK